MACRYSSAMTHASGERQGGSRITKEKAGLKSYSQEFSRVKNCRTLFLFLLRFSQWTLYEFNTWRVSCYCHFLFGISLFRAADCCLITNSQPPAINIYIYYFQIIFKVLSCPSCPFRGIIGGLGQDFSFYNFLFASFSFITFSFLVRCTRTICFAVCFSLVSIKNH